MYLLNESDKVITENIIINGEFVHQQGLIVDMSNKKLWLIVGNDVSSIYSTIMSIILHQMERIGGVTQFSLKFCPSFSYITVNVLVIQNNYVYECHYDVQQISKEDTTHFVPFLLPLTRMPEYKLEQSIIGKRKFSNLFASIILCKIGNSYVIKYAKP